MGQFEYDNEFCSRNGRKLESGKYRGKGLAIGFSDDQKPSQELCLEDPPPAHIFRNATHERQSITTHAKAFAVLGARRLQVRPRCPQSHANRPFKQR